MKKELSLGMAVLGLGALFVLLSLLVFLNPRSRYLVTRKLRVGGLLLSLTAVSQSVACITCYAPIDDYYNTDIITLNEQHSGTTIQVDPRVTPALAGQIAERRSEKFACRLTNLEMAQAMEIGALDGAYDEYTEEFTLPLDPNLPAGRYRLDFFPAHAGEIPTHADGGQDASEVENIATFELILLGDTPDGGSTPER